MMCTDLSTKEDNHLLALLKACFIIIMNLILADKIFFALKTLIYIFLYPINIFCHC